MVGMSCSGANAFAFSLSKSASITPALGLIRSPKGDEMKQLAKGLSVVMIGLVHRKGG
jgi:hypothetical protein